MQFKENDIKRMSKELVYNNRDFWKRVAEGIGGQLAYFKRDHRTRLIKITESDYGNIIIEHVWDDFKGSADKPTTTIRTDWKIYDLKEVPVDDKYISRLKTYFEKYRGLATMDVSDYSTYNVEQGRPYPSQLD